VNSDKIYFDSETAESMINGQDPRLFASAGVDNYNLGSLCMLAAVVNSVSDWEASVVGKNFVEIKHVGKNYTCDAIALKEVMFSPNRKEVA
jgi:hypothetical protein